MEYFWSQTHYFQSERWVWNNYSNQIPRFLVRNSLCRKKSISWTSRKQFKVKVESIQNTEYSTILNNWIPYEGYKDLFILLTEMLTAPTMTFLTSSPTISVSQSEKSPIWPIHTPQPVSLNWPPKYIYIRVQKYFKDPSYSSRRQKSNVLSAPHEWRTSYTTTEFCWWLRERKKKWFQRMTNWKRRSIPKRWRTKETGRDPYRITKWRCECVSACIHTPFFQILLPKSPVMVHKLEPRGAPSAAAKKKNLLRWRLTYKYYELFVTW